MLKNLNKDLKIGLAIPVRIQATEGLFSKSRLEWNVIENGKAFLFLTH